MRRKLRTFPGWPIVSWPKTIHGRIEQLLKKHGRDWNDIEGIVCFQGPGSFTGLRIGLTVGNALSFSLSVPIVAAQDPGWIETGITRLLKGETDGRALPYYGADAHITVQKNNAPNIRWLPRPSWLP